MKKKKILFSADLSHDLIKSIVHHLQEQEFLELITHDPKKEYFQLDKLYSFLKDIDLLIVRMQNDCSLDLLHAARLYGIPTIDDIESILICHNKVALDQAIRKIFLTHQQQLHNINLPQSWINIINDIETFKEWAKNRLPIVLKSHNHNDEAIRFNFLVRDIDEINYFCERYPQALNYPLYIQQFIKCDGIDRKIYVIGEKIYGIKRENPIYIFMREQPDQINCDDIFRNELELSEEMRRLAKILSKELNLKLFGFDLLKRKDRDEYILIDLNYFPGYKGINEIEQDLSEFIINYVKSLPG